MVLHKSPFLYIPEIYGIQAYIRLKNDRKFELSGKIDFLKNVFLCMKRKVSAVFDLGTCRFVD